MILSVLRAFPFGEARNETAKITSDRRAAAHGLNPRLEGFCRRHVVRPSSRGARRHVAPHPAPPRPILVGSLRRQTGVLSAQRRLATTDRRIAKVAQKGTYEHEIIGGLKFMRRPLAAYPGPVKSMGSERISVFLVNQTFRKLGTDNARALTCVSPFHIMNKPRTFCGEVQAGLFGDNAERAEGRFNLRLATAKGSGRC
jgi:hypothetical protein